MKPDTRQSALTRLRRIEGQVRGLQRMIEEDRSCPDIVNQVASVANALSAVTKLLLTSHLSHCARKDPHALDEAVGLITRHWK
ncbi:MAG: metal-sensitive transcriptional regulator [Acidobacteria bacterium]|nr:metal-sensitive transcriptional regulator [Acidobacteriota bacterium]